MFLLCSANLGLYPGGERPAFSGVAREIDSLCLILIPELSDL